MWFVVFAIWHPLKIQHTVMKFRNISRQNADGQDGKRMLKMNSIQNSDTLYR